MAKLDDKGNEWHKCKSNKSNQIIWAFNDLENMMKSMQSKGVILSILPMTA